MSFGLLTAVVPEDVPRILHRVAQGYRGTETAKNLHIWLMIADEIDKFANELAIKIQKGKTRRVKL